MWARRCGAALHPYPDCGDLPKPYGSEMFQLLAKWYNDGPEAFGHRWLKSPKKPRTTSR
jgi:hypothetical protein